MELKEILAKCDHTLLAQTATWEDIRAICDDGMKYQTASVCIPASFVKQAKEYVGDKLAICTVIGFPNGYATTARKCFMAYDAVSCGADEGDMVINIGWAKEGKWAEITAEIAAIKAAGGISSLADAEEFIRLGASRLGTSRIVKLAKAEDSDSSY